MQKIYADRLAAGLCAICGAQRAPHSVRLCLRCLDKGARTVKKSRKARIAKGTCARCDSPPVPGRAACERHLAQARDSIRKFHGQRVASGLCRRCGKPRANADGFEESKVYCPRHIREVTARNRDKRARAAA